LNFLDAHNSYLSYRIKTKDGTVDHRFECRLDSSSMAWVRTFTIYSSTGSQAEHIEHYNLLSCLLNKTTSPDDYKNSIGRMIDNVGDRATRNAAMAHPAGSVFNSGFDCSGILNGEGKLIPLAFLQGPMTIELVLAPFKECFVGTDAEGQSASYVIDNVEYHASCISFNEEYNAKFAQQLRERGVDMSFSTYKTHNTTLNANSVDLSISQNAASVKGSYHVLRSSSKYQSQEYDSLSTYKSGGLRECQWDLGGSQYPQAPLKLANDGVTNLYSHNLMSFNFFRNHALGSSVDDRNFWSTEALNAGQGNHGESYKALPIRRVYGTWVANGNQAYAKYDETSSIPDSTIPAHTDNTNITAAHVAVLKAARVVMVPSMTLASASRNPLTGTALANENTVDFVNMVKTLHFVPRNATDIPLIETGLRCKIGASNATILNIAESTEVGNVDIHGTQGDYTNLRETTLGLDRFFRASPAKPYVAGGVANKNTNWEEDSKNILYPGAPCQCAWGHLASSAGEMAERHVAGIGIPFVNGQNQPVLSKHAGVAFDGWCDIIPDDSGFYLGNSFETHQESPELVSGSDLTNSTPLHLKLEYQGTAEGRDNFFEGRLNSDPFTSFVHIDAVLRLEPDGTLSTSL
jgi:hypothetical protein